MNLLQGNLCVVWCHDSQIHSVGFWSVWLLLYSWFLSALQFPELQYISLQFRLTLIITSQFYPNNNSLSCFIFKFFEIFRRASADWLVLLLIFSLWFMVVQKRLCTNNPYEMTKTTQTAGVWWTLLTFWRSDDITLYLLIICSAVNVKWIRACSLQVLCLFFFFFSQKKA